MPAPLCLKGFQIYRHWLDSPQQLALLEDLRRLVRAAPLVAPVTPGGRQMSVRMTSAGRLGWVSDRHGYRYQDRHPDGGPWPEIPPLVRPVWQALSGVAAAPDCCLVNYYGEGARMGMHQDRDEGDFDMPVVSISLGDEGLFRMGNPTRGGRTESIWLGSGDVVVMQGAARLAYHGIDRIRFGSSRLLQGGGRLSLTLRVVACEPG